MGGGGCQVSTTPPGGPKQSATRRCGERSRKPAFPFLHRRRDRTDTLASIFHGFPFSLAVSVGTHNTPSSRPDHCSEGKRKRGPSDWNLPLSWRVMWPIRETAREN